MLNSTTDAISIHTQGNYRTSNPIWIPERINWKDKKGERIR
jgi:hypothetical protein